MSEPISLKFYRYEDAAKLISETGISVMPDTIRKWAYRYPGVGAWVGGRPVVRAEVVRWALEGVRITEIARRLKEQQKTAA